MYYRPSVTDSPETANVLLRDVCDMTVLPILGSEIIVCWNPAFWMPAKKINKETQSRRTTAASCNGESKVGI